MLTLLSTPVRLWKQELGEGLIWNKSKTIVLLSSANYCKAELVRPKMVTINSMLCNIKAHGRWPYFGVQYVSRIIFSQKSMSVHVYFPYPHPSHQCTALREAFHHFKSFRRHINALLQLGCALKEIFDNLPDTFCKQFKSIMHILDKILKIKIKTSTGVCIWQFL